MPKDNIHYGGWEHRDIHNINGMLFVNPFIIKNISRLAHRIPIQSPT